MERLAHLMLAIATALAMSPGPWVAASHAAGPAPVDRVSPARANLPDWVSRVPAGVPICGVTLECCGFCCVTEEPSDRDRRPAAPLPERSPADSPPSPWGQPLPPGVGALGGGAGPPAGHAGLAGAESAGVVRATASISARLSTVCRRLT
ncbi:MAG: hypothetical protein AAGA57_12445 [Planctomycetota bacterium]